jgi:hypothetical protein
LPVGRGARVVDLPGWGRLEAAPLRRAAAAFRASGGTMRCASERPFRRVAASPRTLHRRQNPARSIGRVPAASAWNATQSAMPAPSSCCGSTHRGPTANSSTLPPPRSTAIARSRSSRPPRFCPALIDKRGASHRAAARDELPRRPRPPACILAVRLALEPGGRPSPAPALGGLRGRPRTVRAQRTRREPCMCISIIAISTAGLIPRIGQGAAAVWFPSRARLGPSSGGISPIPPSSPPHRCPFGRRREAGMPAFAPLGNATIVSAR